MRRGRVPAALASADTKTKTIVEREAIPVVGQNQLSFPFQGEVTGQSFGQSLLAFATGDEIPMGRNGAYLVGQFKFVRDAIDLLEQRYTTALMANQDALPGIGLAEGAQVRELKTSPVEVRAALKEEIPPLSAFLRCCRPSLTALEKQIQAQRGCSPEEARMILDRCLEDQITYRQNRPSLVRLSRQEALAQAERLEGRDQ